MDAWHASFSIAGVCVGWWLRGLALVKEDPKPCVCQCSCQVPVSPVENSSNWFSQIGLWVAIAVGLGGLAANLAVAFRVTVVNRGDQKELSLAWTPQQKGGKSRGVFGSPKGLQILG